jgi:hypothetical protein
MISSFVIVVSVTLSRYIFENFRKFSFAFFIMKYNLFYNNLYSIWATPVKKWVPFSYI